MLNLLAHLTGGRYFAIASPDDMKEACASVADDLRYQYVLGFETQATGKNAFRAIQVEVRNKKAKQVLSRKGYQGLPPAVEVRQLCGERRLSDGSSDLSTKDGGHAMKRVNLAVTAVMLTAMAGWGCATKKYVAGEVGQVGDARRRRPDPGRGRPDQDQGPRRPHHQERAGHGHGVEDRARRRSTAPWRRAGSPKGKLLYETVLSDDKVKFGFDKAELSAEAKAALDAFAAQLKTENKNVYVEVQGHTDNVGGELYNEKLGKQRAEAVEEYLAKQGIPLFRIESISYGESEPVADNKTREGRAQNRRVVLVVLQ